MILKKFKHIIAGSLTALMALAPSFASGQNMAAASNYRNAHEQLLASQSNILDQRHLKEAQNYASGLYEEEEPEPDIYTEGWDSGLVNPYKDAVIPGTKDIDVSNYVMPVMGVVTSRYGYRKRFRRSHKGIDLNLNTGDTVRAAFDGKVRLTKYERKGYGFYVILRHENGLETVYGHLSRFLVEPDQTVKAGDPIALGGNTGRSTGPHLHFETRFMGLAINPEAIFDFENHTTHTDIFTFNKNNFDSSRDYSPRATRAKASSKGKSTKSKFKNSGKGSYTIRKGDNLSSISARTGVSVSELQRLNGLGSSSKITAGKTLKTR